MRKLGVATISLVAMFAFVGSAFAATTEQTLSLSLSTNKVSKSPSLKATFKTFTDDGTKPSPGTETDVYLPSGMKVNFSKFKICSNATLTTVGPTGCPAGSKVGSGTATVDASPISSSIPATVTAFNGGTNKLELYTDVGGPAPQKLPLEGTLKNATGKFGKVLKVDLTKVPTEVFGIQVAIIKFSVTLNGTHYLTNPSTCNKKWAFQGKSKFVDKSIVTTPVSVKCKK